MIEKITNYSHCTVFSDNLGANQVSSEFVDLEKEMIKQAVELAHERDIDPDDWLVSVLECLLDTEVYGYSVSDLARLFKVDSRLIEMALDSPAAVDVESKYGMAAKAARLALMSQRGFRSQ